MKINFSAVILDLEGEPVKNGSPDWQVVLELLKAGNVKDAVGYIETGIASKVVTLGMAAAHACIQNDQTDTDDQKYNKFRLAILATNGGEQDVKVEEVSLLKKLIAKAYAPLVVGRAYDIIEAPQPTI